MEPLTVYAMPEQSWATDHGDGIFDGLVPTGWLPVVYQQPVHGTVEILSATGWRFNAAPTPAVDMGSVMDSWQWRATNGTDFGEIHTVNVELVRAL